MSRFFRQNDIQLTTSVSPLPHRQHGLAPVCPSSPLAQHHTSTPSAVETQFVSSPATHLDSFSVPLVRKRFGVLENSCKHFSDSSTTLSIWFWFRRGNRRSVDDTLAPLARSSAPSRRGLLHCPSPQSGTGIPSA